jgi:tetratricopeptide (TPR) repeat protein
MPIVRHAPWARVALAALALSTLALCSPSDPELDRKLADVQASIDAKKWDEALAAARALVEANGSDARTHAALGAALLGKAREEHTEVDPERLQEAKQANDPAAFFDPSLFRTEVAYDDTLRGQAEAELKKALAADPSLLDASIALATIYAEMNRFPEEKETIAAAARAHAGQEDAGARLLSFGERHFKAAAYPQAFEIFTLLSASFPQQPAVVLDAAAGMFATGKYAEGIAELEKAVAANPANDRMLSTLGEMYVFRSEWRKAADAFGRLAPLVPKDLMPVVEQGAALMPVDADRAKALFDGVVGKGGGTNDRAVTMAKNLTIALTNPAVGADDTLRMAADLVQLSYPQIATAVCGLVLAREPQNLGARLMLGFIYDHLGYYDLALARIDEVKGLVTARGTSEPGQISLTDLNSHYGRVYFHMGEYRKAIDAFSAAKSPERFDLFVGLSYEKLGDLAKAYDHLSRVVAAGQPEALVKEAKARLAADQYAPFRKSP